MKLVISVGFLALAFLAAAAFLATPSALRPRAHDQFNPDAHPLYTEFRRHQLGGAEHAEHARLIEAASRRLLDERVDYYDPSRDEYDESVDVDERTGVATVMFRNEGEDINEWGDYLYVSIYAVGLNPDLTCRFTARSGFHVRSPNWGRY